MIIKHVRMNATKKSNFVGLVNYLTGPQGKDERVGFVRVTNCLTLDARTAALEVLSTQLQNSRSQADKTYHLIVSFRAGEAPDTDILKSIEQIICDGLGFGQHQRISVVHHDTDNLHMHIAINKIHPTRLTVHEPYNAYHTFAKLCGQVENTFNLQRDNHTATKVSGENRAADMEQQAAVESLLGWVKRECAGQIREARTWAQLHQTLADHGLSIRVRANGFVIASEDNVAVKASSVAREFSKEKLESRLGTFEPPSPAAPQRVPRQRYTKQPTATQEDTTALFAMYKGSQHLAMAARADEWRKAVRRKQRQIAAAKRTGRLKRAAIKLVRASRIGKKMMYAVTSKALADEIAEINRQYLKERQRIYERYQRLTWADWLRREASMGNPEALRALRSRKKKSAHDGDSLYGKGSLQDAFAGVRHDSVTKTGTLIYRLGASVVRDDGTRLEVSRGASQAEVLAALRLAMARYGGCIAVSGSDHFKEHIARAAAVAHLPVSFDDDALERRRLLLAQSLTKKGKHHGNETNHQPGTGRRPDRRRDGSRAAAASRATQVASAQPPAGHRQHPQGTKLHAGDPRAAPPATARHHLRVLSELGVVHVAERSEMLLPGHVPDHMGKQGAEPTHGMRRHFHRPGRRAPHVKRTTQGADGKPMMASAGTAPPPVSQGRLLPLSRLGKLAVGEANTASPRNHEQQATKATVGQPRPLRKRVGHPQGLAPAPPSARVKNVQTSTSAEPVRAVEKDAGPAENPAKNIHAPSKALRMGAAEKYVIEREQKRVKGFDIPNHKVYTFSDDTSAEFIGLRRVDGQALALLRLDDGIAVLPVDDATAQRLKRLPRGQMVTATAAGGIKTKGRSR